MSPVQGSGSAHEKTAEFGGLNSWEREHTA